MAKVHVEPVFRDPQFEPEGEHGLARSKLRSKVFVGFSITISVLCLLCVATELASMGIRSYLGWLIRERFNDTMINQRFYRDKPWAKQYWKEYSESGRFEFTPYVTWRRKAFAGEYVNVDANGIRRTANPDCSPGARRIWMFGASGLWGVGAKDDETIPSILAAKYSKSIGPVCVTNFSEIAWVNSQEVIQLEIALKRAPDPPDLVLFYDGYGDTFATYESGREDSPMNFDPLRQRMEEDKEQAGFALKQTNTYRLMGDVMGQLLRARVMTGSQTAASTAPPKDLDLDARMVVDNYQGNIRLLEPLSKAFGFRYFIFWQPVIFLGHKKLDPEERKERDSYEGDYPGLSQLLRKSYDRMFSADKRIVDLTDVFDQRVDPVFVDYAHTSPFGNRLIAQRMLETILRCPDCTHKDVSAAGCIECPVPSPAIPIRGVTAVN
jgi:hypothetical protein